MEATEMQHAHQGQILAALAGAILLALFLGYRIGGWGEAKLFAGVIVVWAFLFWVLPAVPHSPLACLDHKDTGGHSACFRADGNPNFGGWALIVAFIGPLVPFVELSRRRA